MNHNHTPGPWTYQATAGEHDFAVYSESDGKDRALVRDYHEANARLIAAAPDLLAALVKAEAILAQLCEHPQDAVNIALQGYTGHARECARAALAKAAGSQ